MIYKSHKFYLKQEEAPDSSSSNLSSSTFSRGRISYRTKGNTTGGGYAYKKAKWLITRSLKRNWFPLRVIDINLPISSVKVIGWKHILIQSPSPISSVKVIAWEIAWLNKECRDQVILLPGFDYTFFSMALLLCLLPLCLWVIFVFCFVEDCLASSSFGWLF
jgi:hypothetical protein